MSDHILYNEETLSTAAAELDRLAGIMSDVTRQLNRVDTSDEWWEHVKGSDGNSAVGQVRALRKTSESLDRRSTQLAGSVRQTVQNFDEAESESRSRATGLAVGTTLGTQLRGQAQVGDLDGAFKQDEKPGFWSSFLEGLGLDAFLGVVDMFAEVFDKYKDYLQSGNIHGMRDAMVNFFKHFTGLTQEGRLAENANGDWWKMFKGNLKNKTSPFNFRTFGQAFKDKLGDFAGKNGKGHCFSAWFDLLVTGAVNYQDNLEEQAASGGKMTTGRVVSETVLETVIDTAIDVGAKAGVGMLVGSALAAFVPGAAIPLVVGVASSLIVNAVDAAVEHFTGKSVCEWVSDGILNGLEAVGRGLKTAGDTVAGWFKKLGAAPAW